MPVSYISVSVASDLDGKLCETLGFGMHSYGISSPMMVTTCGFSKTYSSD